MCLLPHRLVLSEDPTTTILWIFFRRTLTKMSPLPNPSNNVLLEHCLISLPTKKKTQFSIAAFAQPISKHRTLELHALLCEAFVLGNIPGRFYENPAFQEYQRRFVVAIYTLPNRKQQRDQILPFLHANFMEDLLVSMNTTNKLTLSLGGWTDCSGVSIYAVMLHESYIS